jgi:DNA-binding transcriptional ArsR family regulator
VLANDTRLRILHALIREGELCVSELSEVLGMRQQTVSNQLQKLTDRNIVQPKRNGNHIYYRIVDPCIHNLIDRGFCIMEESFDNKNNI